MGFLLIKLLERELLVVIELPEKRLLVINRLIELLVRLSVVRLLVVRLLVVKLLVVKLFVVGISGRGLLVISIRTTSTSIINIEVVYGRIYYLNKSLRLLIINI